MSGCSKTVRGPSRHPFIAALAETSAPIRKIIQGLSDAGTPLFKAILALEDARASERGQAQALAAADETPLEGSDPEVAAFFLERWSTLSFRMGRLDESKALVRRARELLSDRTHPIIEASVLRCEAGLARKAGNHTAAKDLLRRSLSIVDSPRRPPFLLDYAHFLAARWEETEVDAEFDALPKTVLQSFKNGVALCRLLQFVETGRLDEAQAVLAVVEKDPELAASLERGQANRAVLAAMLGSPSSPGPDSAVIAPTMHLLARRPQEALQAARALAAADAESFLTDSVFLAFDLIRAELACGHGDAAERLILARRQIGNCHPMDDFLLARVRLLAGDRARAAAHFASFLASIERCRADGRLDFELRLACELSPADAVGLMRGASGRRAVPAPEPARRTPARPLGGADRLVGASHSVEQIRKSVRLLAPLDVPVLVMGETGTGKELVARALHEESLRAKAPFITVNCGAIAESLLESELFGHEKGAFTGAERTRRGLFEEAGTGTLFLDEIGEISSRLQVSLLRVLETGEIRPVGASRERRMRCRIVAATNADLDALAAAGSFRQDLLFRLKRMELRILPLRERREDILLLADHFLCEGRADGRRPELTAALKRELTSRDWPGNVRELRNAVERMRLLNSDGLRYDLEAPDSGNRSASAPTAPGASPQSGPNPPTPASAGAPDDAEVSRVLGEGRTALRRRERLMELFDRCRRLTRAEVVKLMRISPATATADLKALVAEGRLDRIEPSASTRSHYFAIRGKAP